MTKTTKTTKATKNTYPLKFKQDAVRLVEGGQSVAAVAKTLAVVEQTLYNWVKAHREGKLIGAESQPVSEQMGEISWLQAELARVTMQRDILAAKSDRRSGIERRGSANSVKVVRA